MKCSVCGTGVSTDTYRSRCAQCSWFREGFSRSLLGWSVVLEGSQWEGVKGGMRMRGAMALIVQDSR